MPRTWLALHLPSLTGPWLDIKLYLTPRLRGFAWDALPLTELLATSGGAGQRLEACQAVAGLVAGHPAPARSVQAAHHAVAQAASTGDDGARVELYMTEFQIEGWWLGARRY